MYETSVLFVNYRELMKTYRCFYFSVLQLNVASCLHFGICEILIIVETDFRNIFIS